jgi:hypothetical protein
VSTALRRRERRPRTGATATWTTRLPLSTRTHDEVEAKPVGTRMAVAIAPGVFATVIKIGPGVWSLCRRSGIPSAALAAVPTAMRAQVEDATP